MALPAGPCTMLRSFWCPPVVVALDPEKLYPDGRPDYLRENRTRERQYDFDYVFGPKSTQEEVRSAPHGGLAGFGPDHLTHNASPLLCAGL